MTEIPELKFDEQGLIPAVIQDYKDGTILMLAYMNRESLELTLRTGRTHFFSRSRQSIWAKGETSGHIQIVKSIKYDCDGDALLVAVDQTGAACHTGERSCFFHEVEGCAWDKQENDSAALCVMDDLYTLLGERKVTLPEGSYTAELFKKGIDTILKKVGEEATEVVIASKNHSEEEIVYEMADLWFHCLVALAYHEIKPIEVLRELNGRKGRGKPIGR